MAHFAKLNDNNEVVQVIVVANEELMDNGVESEAKGIAFCQSLFGGRWVQTSYNGNFRKRYAGVGYKYDPIKDEFISPQEFINEAPVEIAQEVTEPASVETITVAPSEMVINLKSADNTVNNTASDTISL